MNAWKRSLPEGLGIEVGSRVVTPEGAGHVTAIDEDGAQVSGGHFSGYYQLDELQLDLDDKREQLLAVVGAGLPADELSQAIDHVRDHGGLSGRKLQALAIRMRERAG